MPRTKVPAPVVKVAQRAVGGKLGQVVQTINPLQFVGDIVRYYSELQSTETERQRIEAQRQIALAEIEAKRTLFLEYLDHAFAERAENFKRLFNAVDAALAQGNTDELALTLHTITDLAKTTPMANFVDMQQVRKVLSKQDHEWPL
ncbi:MAG: hypothetical protein WBG50_25615 [Desulfomonilaceae bacterium]